MGSYESPLGSSKGGIESIVLLIDTNLFNLPFEHLKVFQEVPAISRDFSLLLLGKREPSSLVGLQIALTAS